MSKLIYPLVSVAQSFTDTQKAQVRANIGVYSTAEVDAEIIRATAAEALKENKSEKNAASGYCPLDANVKVPFANIPDSILGQLEYQGVWDASTGNFPAATGSGQYWIASSNGTGSTISYSTGDWAVYNGTAFDKVDNSDAVFSVNGKIGNVVLEKADVGLGNVDNVSDANKPVSIATQTALDLKANQTSISNVDNTSDANKPVSTATQTALDLKANKLTTVNNSTDTAYTFLASDANTCHIVNTSAATTRTVPSDTTAPDIAIGDSIEVVNVGTGTVTFAAASGVTLLSSLTLVMYGQYSVCMLRKIAANTWILTGERRAI